MAQNIRIRLKAYDHEIIDTSTKKIVETVLRTHEAVPVNAVTIAGPGTPIAYGSMGFLTSAVAFAIHIGYEHFRLRNSPRITASHVSIAVALGALALAVSANVHGYVVGSSNKRPLAFALVAWPAITAVPAFVVALVAAAGLALTQRST
jgi:hypothetical protein